MPHFLTKSLLALAIVGALSACNGDDGTNGVNGADGQNGADGKDAPRTLVHQVVGRYATGAYGEGAAEIVQYHKASQTVFVVNGADNRVDMLSIASLPDAEVSDPVTDNSLSATQLALPTSVSVTLADNSTKQVALGNANSIAVSGDLLAVAVANDSKTDAGVVLFYAIADTPTLIKAVEAGSLPDMVTFSHDGALALVANEGEPNSDYSVDPEGSISVIAISDGTPADLATTLSFSAFNAEQAALAEAGVKFANPGDSTVAQDLEPEYIAVAADNSRAWVSLQENNAIAEIDLATLSISAVHPLGFKDWSQYLMDASDKDGGVNFARYDNVLGMYQPDTIASYSWKGASFVVTANEGDSRDYWFDAEDEAACLAAGGVEFDEDDGCLAYSEETRAGKVDIAAGAEFDTLRAQTDDNAQLGRLKITNALGANDSDEFETLYAYGARSFSIFDQNGQLVFDSGDDFGRITASIHGSNFNNEEDDNDGDSRSDDKAGEPEALAIGTIGERTYAFIGLERMGGIFTYDITNPYAVSFVDYNINRGNLDAEFDYASAGDLAPEGMKFIAAEDSPNGNPLLVVGNEVSGTVTIWQISEQ